MYSILLALLVSSTLDIFVPIIYIYLILFLDLQKLEREARICRMLKHPNIGMNSGSYSCSFDLLISWKQHTIMNMLFCVICQEDKTTHWLLFM